MADILEKYPSLKKFENESYVEVWSHDGREIALLKHIYSHPSLPQMRKSPSKIVEIIDEFAAQQDFLINIGPDKGKIVTGIIAEEKPDVFVELGGYIGYSAILFGDAIRKAGGENSGRRFWSLEFDPLFASIAMNLIELAGLSDLVKVVVGDAEDSLKRLRDEGQLESIDILFLDHVEDLYLPHFLVCQKLNLLKEGALVVADNVVRPGAPQYRKHVREDALLESWGVKGLIIPGDAEDELEVTRIKKEA